MTDDKIPQALVRAFELITAPVMATEDTSKATKSSKAPVGIARSNEGVKQSI